MSDEVASNLQTNPSESPAEPGGARSIASSEANISSQPSQGAQLPPPELFNKFLDLQAKELDIRVKELEVESLKQINAHDFSKKAVDLQATFFMQEGKFRHGRFRWGIVVGGIITLSSFVLLGILALHGAEKIAEEILKDIVLLIGGGAGGYGVARYKSTQPQSAPSNNSAEDG